MSNDRKRYNVEAGLSKPEYQAGIAIEHLLQRAERLQHQMRATTGSTLPGRSALDDKLDMLTDALYEERTVSFEYPPATSYDDLEERLRQSLLEDIFGSLDIARVTHRSEEPVRLLEHAVSPDTRSGEKHWTLISHSPRTPASYQFQFNAFSVASMRNLQLGPPGSATLRADVVAAIPDEATLRFRLLAQRMARFREFTDAYRDVLVDVDQDEDEPQSIRALDVPMSVLLLDTPAAGERS